MTRKILEGYQEGEGWKNSIDAIKHVDIVGIIMIGIGWYKKSKSDKKVFQYIKERD